MSGIKLLKFIMYKLYNRRRADENLSAIANSLPPIVSVDTSYGEINFYCLGVMPTYRAYTLLTKEPETIAWINSFNKKDIFWDIGANVGVYSLYAAKRGINVTAFEPSPVNYYLLNKNIEINDISSHVKAFCLALSDSNSMDVLHMKNTIPGGNGSSFSSNIDSCGKQFSAFFEQGMIGMSADEIVEKYNIKFPNHIKIDVDGIEEMIISGMDETLKDSRLLSVSIEMDPLRPEYFQRMINKMQSYDFYRNPELNKQQVVFYRKKSL
ncbi:FkbM family methyltransferase [bacterium]|nr:FkbM family methyltransferase [bacterium]